MEHVYYGVFLASDNQNSMYAHNVLLVKRKPNWKFYKNMESKTLVL